MPDARKPPGPALRRTGKPLGRPPGTVAVIPTQPTWLKTQESYQQLIHWLALCVPRRLILQYCEEVGIKVPGPLLGQQLQVLANFSVNHREEILLAHDTIRAMALDDAQERRVKFLDLGYSVLDTMHEHMMTDRDGSGRTHMLRDFIHLFNSLAELEGFKKGTFNPREQKAIEALTNYMFGDKDAAAPVEPTVTVLQGRQLPAGQ